MNKKIKNLFLAGVLVLGFAGVAVSCTDYDDDINKMQDDIAAQASTIASLKTTVDQLQSSINAGAVITSVTELSGEPGGWKVTLSDGKTFDIKNGAKGADGEKGADGSIVTIGEDGYWYIDGKKTDVVAKAQDGKAGSVVTIGDDGYWYIDGEKTEYKAASESNIVWDTENGVLKITVGEETFEVNLNAALTSLVFQPQVYVGGVEGMLYTSLTYLKLVNQTVNKKATLDTKEERWIPAIDLVEEEIEAAAQKIYAEVAALGLSQNETYLLIQEKLDSLTAPYIIKEAGDVEAQYHFNNSDVTLDESYEYSFIVRENVPYIRATASSDFTVVPAFVSYENGNLKVKVKVFGRPAVPALYSNRYNGFSGLIGTRADANGNETSVLETRAPGSDDYSSYISVVALQAKKGNLTVVSDYATIFGDNYSEFTIAEPQLVASEHFNKKISGVYPRLENHYRESMDDWYTDGPGFPSSYYKFKNNGYIIWQENYNLEDARATSDTTVLYTESLDLNTIVAAHFNGNELSQTMGDMFHNELTEAKMKELGLTWKFELVKNYKVGEPKTDQADFATLSADGIFTPKVFGTNGQAAVGRTPVVRVSLMHGENVVYVSFIKIFITDVDPVEHIYTLHPVDNKGVNAFKAGCFVDSLQTTVEEMNVEIYNNTLPKDKFHKVYDAFDYDDEGIGYAVDIYDPNSATEATHVIRWYVDYEDLYELAAQAIADKKPLPDSISLNVWYYDETNPDSKVSIVLKAGVPDLADLLKYDITAPEYVASYWDAELTATNYNVKVPAVGSDDDDLCQFVVPMNASFKTVLEGDKKGQILLDNSNNLSVEYFFCKDVTGIKKIGDIDVKFSLEPGVERSTNLYAAIKGANGQFGTPELIATIDNDADAYSWNIFNYMKGKDQGTTVCDTLLNTGKMYTLIGAVGYLCGDVDFPIELTFQGVDHFRANIIRPIEITSTPSEGFVDGVSFGKPGSYVEIGSLVNPFDWRGEYFNASEKKNNVVTYYNEYLWDYYGVESITIDTENAMTDLYGTKQGLPSSLVVQQWASKDDVIFPGDGTTPAKLYADNTNELEEDSERGFLTYYNNLVTVQKDFNIYVTAVIKYTFGYLRTEEITIPVKKTIGQ